MTARNRDGYIEVYAPGHPTAGRGGKAMQHRIVAWDAGILTDLSFHVHHLNGIRDDNRPENLAAMPPGAHGRHHHPAPEHGQAGYRRGCRCDECRGANAARCLAYYHRAGAQKRRERSSDPR